MLLIDQRWIYRLNGARSSISTAEPFLAVHHRYLYS